MDTGDASPTAYDQVLYPVAVYPAMRANRLATVATLKGIEPAHDLRFVGEASSDDLHPENLAPEVLSKPNELEKEDEIIHEQCKDFGLGRAFELAPAFLTERTPTLHA